MERSSKSFKRGFLCFFQIHDKHVDISFPYVRPVRPVCQLVPIERDADFSELVGYFVFTIANRNSYLCHNIYYLLGSPRNESEGSRCSVGRAEA